MNNDKLSIQRPPIFVLFKLIFYNLIGFFSRTKTVKFSGDLKNLADPKKLTIVYVGHATVFINFYGTTILTDPVFAGYFPGFARFIEPGLKISDLPDLDFVLISHAHFDHLNRKSLSTLASKTKTLIIPKNDSDLVSDLGFRQTVELQWNKELANEDLKIFALKPQHWGHRFPWESNRRGYNAYIISKKNTNILFAGDTAYTENFKVAAKKIPIDVALLPIGAYNPEFFQRFHLSPQQALKVFEEINAKYLIPIHWGTFRLSLESLDDPPKLLQMLMQEKKMQEKLKLLYPGEFFQLPYPQ